MKILVLCGGESPERIVSLSSGDAVASWIAEAGYEALKYDPENTGKVFNSHEQMAPTAIGLTPPQGLSRKTYNPKTVNGLLRIIEEHKPDLVFPILHGGRGEDGTLQALLEWIGIPFTGTGALACGVAMNKELARTVMRSADVPVTKGFVVPEEIKQQPDKIASMIESSFGFPTVFKPLWGGSTVGLTKVNSQAEIKDAVRAIVELGDEILIEANFNGREIAATVIIDEAYPLIEIKPKVGFYDYSNKYTSGRSEYICPAEISNAKTIEIQRCAETAFRAIGCKGFSRLDFLLNEDGQFVCLEVNTLPGMTINSLVPKAARQKGIQSPQLMQIIIENALASSGNSR